MICLGIESTAHTFGVGIMEDKKMLANEKDIFATEKGGFIPGEVARHHVSVWKEIISTALEKAGLSIRDIGLISYSKSPGIGQCLNVGCNVSRALHIRYGIPVVGVNHCIAHLEIGRQQSGAKDPVLLYASGANTQIIAYDEGKYRIFGETLDGGIGNFIDSLAREMGLGFPGGPKIEMLAREGKKLIDLPYVVKGMDTSFGGILTNVKQKLESGKFTKEDIAFSVQETVFAMLVEVTERAMAHCQKKEVVLGGGVGCNKRLQEMLRIMCNERNAKSYVPDNQFLVDNGAMIAWQGILQKENPLELKDITIEPYLRTDEVEVTWR